MEKIVNYDDVDTTKPKYVYMKYDDCSIFKDTKCKIELKLNNPDTMKEIKCCIPEDVIEIKSVDLADYFYYSKRNEKEVYPFFRHKLNETYDDSKYKTKSTDNYHLKKLMKIIDDDRLTKYRYSVVLYTYHGDVMLSKYMGNDKKINVDLVEYYNHHYGNLNYFRNNIDSKCGLIPNLTFLKCFMDVFIEDLNKMFELVKPIDFNLKVYRKIYVDEDTLNKYKHNTVIKFPFYTSTSFVDVPLTKTNDIEVIFNIILPKGTKCLPILHRSIINDEYEILLNKDSIFYIYNEPIKSFNDVYLISLYYLDDFQKNLLESKSKSIFTCASERISKRIPEKRTISEIDDDVIGSLFDKKIVHSV